MSAIFKDRLTAQIEGDFVIFLIGMRINQPWKIGRWFAVARAMTRMLTELSQNPDLGLLNFHSHLGFPDLMVVQYWRSFELLEAYARDKNRAHLPAWNAFHRTIGTSGDVGIWHETYCISAGQSESVYVNMPPYGLGKAGELIPATGYRASAATRLGRNS